MRAHMRTRRTRLIEALVWSTSDTEQVVEEIAEEFGVTSDTVQSDLDDCETWFPELCEFDPRPEFLIFEAHLDRKVLRRLCDTAEAAGDVQQARLIQTNLDQSRSKQMSLREKLLRSSEATLRDVPNKPAGKDTESDSYTVIDDENDSYSLEEVEDVLGQEAAQRLQEEKGGQES